MTRFDTTSIRIPTASKPPVNSTRVFRFTALALACILPSILPATSLAQSTQTRRMIHLEVSADGRARLGSQQEWMEMLQDVGADKVSVRTASTGTPTVEENVTGGSTLISVTGFIVGKQLRLPGGVFGIRNKAGIRELLQRIRDDGATVALAEKKAFGMTSEQLVGLHQKFSTIVDVETAGHKAGDVVARMIEQTGLPFVLSTEAKAALSGNEKVAEELKGMSVGTSLATVVRPLGLVIQPQRLQGKPMEIHIVDSRASQENWPIGWPPDRVPVVMEPKLFERMPIEIRGFPMQNAMQAIEKRCGVPFLYDHNTLAREGIEMADVKVTLVNKEIGLMVAIGKILRQSKPRLSEELRMDEAGKPFLWITVR